MVEKKSLAEIQEELDFEMFFRINRKFIVNANYIANFKAVENSKILLALTLPLNDQLIISQETAPIFKNYLSSYVLHFYRAQKPAVQSAEPENQATDITGGRETLPEDKKWKGYPIQFFFTNTLSPIVRLLIVISSPVVLSALLTWGVSSSFQMRR